MCLWRGTPRSGKRDLLSFVSLTRRFNFPSFQNILYPVMLKRKSDQVLWSFMLHMSLFFTCGKTSLCSLMAGTTTIILCFFFRSKHEIRKALYWNLALNCLVLTSNWNITVNKLSISSCIFLGSSYYMACRQQSSFLKEVIALLSTKQLSKAANR